MLTCLNQSDNQFLFEQVVCIPESTNGILDVDVLEEKLQEAVAEKLEGRLLIGMRLNSEVNCLVS